MTTRKTRAALGAAGMLLVLAACATPGALHVYSLAATSRERVQDAGGATAADAPSFLQAEDTLTGFAYDPFTDHFFLRLAPGNKLRVVDRPARAIKREFELEGVPATGGGDLAVRPASGHIYLLHPTEAAVIETTRLGKFVRTFRLEGLSAAAAGIAFDAARDELLVLAHDGREIVRCDLNGKKHGGFTLERVVGSSLGFDAEHRELYAPLAAGGGGGSSRSGTSVGVFAETGKLVRTLPGDASVVDVGPRSFIRVF